MRNPAHHHTTIFFTTSCSSRKQGKVRSTWNFRWAKSSNTPDMVFLICHAAMSEIASRRGQQPKNLVGVYGLR